MCTLQHIKHGVTSSSSVRKVILEALLQFFYGLVETGSCNIDAEQNGKATFSLSLQRTVFPLSTFGVFQTLHLSALMLQQDGMKKSQDQMLDEIEKLLKQQSHLCQHLVC